MSLIKVKQMNAIEDGLLHDTMMNLKAYAVEHGRGDELYKKIGSQVMELVKEIVETDNLVLTVDMNIEAPIVVLIELDMLDDGNSYRVVNFVHDVSGDDYDYVEIIPIP